MHVQAGAGIVYDSEPAYEHTRMRQQGEGLVSGGGGGGAVCDAGEEGSVR